MIGWTELLGRMIAFIVEKVADKQIDLFLDDRRRAARQFLRLYHALCDLELLSKELVVELRAMAQSNDPEVSAEWIRNISDSAAEISQRFLEATSGLRDVLRIFDPILASTVSDLEAHKFSFLIIAARGLEPVDCDEEVAALRFTQPSDRLTSMDLTENYNWYAENYPLDSTRSLEWPSWVTWGIANPEDIREGVLELGDPDSLRRLADLLECHLRTLTSAREGLAALVRDEFKIEDFLAVQESKTQFDRLHAMKRTSNALAIRHVRWLSDAPTSCDRGSDDSRDAGPLEDPSGG
jgi:hypothetical protein